MSPDDEEPIELTFEFAPPTPKARPAEAADRWPPEADEFADRLFEQRKKLLAARKLDRTIGVLVTVGALLLMISADSGPAVMAVFTGVLLLVAVYLPVRVRPRQLALEVLTARLVVVDPRCGGCGYPLRHLRQSRCPECGRRVSLPLQHQIEHVLEGGDVLVARGSVASDLGWIVLLLMVLVASAVASLAGWSYGVAAAALPAAFFLLRNWWQLRRAVKRVPAEAPCDKCGRVLPLSCECCPECHARRLAEHVYARPGLNGEFDARLHCSWAKIAGGLMSCLALFTVGMATLDSSRFSRSDWETAEEIMYQIVPLVTAVAAIVVLSFDERKRRQSRLDRFDTSSYPLCHHCLQSLRGLPANGVCPHCDMPYRAIELAGGS